MGEITKTGFKGTFKAVEKDEELEDSKIAHNEDSKGYEYYKDGSIFKGTIRNSTFPG